MAAQLKFHNGNGGKFHNGAQISFHEPISEPVGGGSGGRSRQVGVPLGERPWKRITALSEGRLLVKSEAVSKSKIQVLVRVLSESVLKPLSLKGVSFGSLLIPSKVKSEAKLKHTMRNESTSFVYDVKKVNKWFAKSEKFQKLMRLAQLFHSAELLDNTYSEKRILTFSFQETVNDEALKAFTHSSSFVGNVRYDPQAQSMEIIINGKTYSFCNVPERVFDAFEGAPSKGAFFARNIKGQFNC